MLERGSGRINPTRISKSNNSSFYYRLNLIPMLLLAHRHSILDFRLRRDRSVERFWILE
jgi:hypothetical protein